MYSFGRKTFYIIILLFFNSILCFPQDTGENIENKGKYEIMIGVGLNLFGSFFQECSWGFGLNIYISEYLALRHNNMTVIYNNNFIINNNITYEYFDNGNTQFRLSSHLTYLLLIEAGVSWSIYIVKSGNIFLGFAPEIAIGLPPMHLLPIAPSILYRYNIYDLHINSTRNYHEISLSIRMLLFSN